MAIVENAIHFVCINTERVDAVFLNRLVRIKSGWEIMSNHKKTQATFTMGEVIYILFRKKQCPTCSGKMTRFKKSNKYTVDCPSQLPDRLSTKSDGSYSSMMSMKKGIAVDVTEHTYHYECTKCKSNFPLAELAKRE